ncbi:MAG TPA: glutathione S-transferase family protein [Hyphomicrobiaceae bacterium]|nr:glutathione S-transferase family protein [Hyphomicrobiaceae bacterium]
MGILIDGAWHDRWYDTDKTGGRFVRADSSFRNWVTPDGAAGPTGSGGFKAEPGRYHLYVSLACPWASRTLIYRVLKRLEGAIGLSVTHWLMGEQGWTFEPGEGVVPDPINGVRYLHQLYTLADPAYSGRASVPVLWDKERRTIVNNESSEIIRMLNSAFDGVGAAPGDYYPKPRRTEIDIINARVYDTVNNGVYKAGFATTQEAYEAAVGPLFDSLDWLEARLANRRFLLGAKPLEADWRLFTTLIRFDAVYFGHFKCNIRRVVDYPSLWGYTRDLYQWPGVRETVNFKHIKRHYYMSHARINPTRIVPAGPRLDLDAPHGRAAL